MHDLQENYGTTRSSQAIKPQFVVGALVGAGLALLLAPANGSDTRRKLGATAQRLGTNAKHVMGRTRSMVEGLKNDARSAVQSGREEFKRSQRREESSAWSA